MFVCECILIVFFICCSAEIIATKPPNIVIIVADDLGWNDVGFHGSRQIPTPHLDKLAREGVILNNHYTQPICTPTRAALLTGRYPIHLGLQHSVIHAPEPYGLPLNETLLPEYLNQLGYSSHIVGKWHLGFYAKQYTPTYRGFSSHLGYYTGMEDYWDHTRSYPMYGWGLDFRRGMKAELDCFGQYSTELFTNESIKIINSHDKNKPLFLYLAHQAVHGSNLNRPLEAPWKYYAPLTNIKDKDRRMFGAMVSALDESVGRVYEALRMNKMVDNTIIVFTSDNGGPANHFQSNMASNWPLRGVKTLLWEGGIRAAAFIWSPLLTSAGRVNHQLMHVSDWLPTLLSVAGSNATLDHLDGLNQWKSLSDNQPTSRREILHNIDDNQPGGAAVWAIRFGDFKLISPNWSMRHWFGWYPPVGSTEPLKFEPKHVTNFKYHHASTADHRNHRHDIKDLDAVESKLKEISKKYSRRESEIVDCGPKPADAATNCKPGLPCLYHIPSDPCEYKNLYDVEGDVVAILYERYMYYRSEMVKPLNKPADWRSMPKYHNNTWSPWIEIDENGREYYSKIFER